MNQFFKEQNICKWKICDGFTMMSALFFSCPVCQFLSLYLDIYSWVGSLYLQSSVLDSIICLLLDRRIRLSAQWARGNKLRAEERQSDPEREARLLCPVSTLWWWGQRGAKKQEGGGRQWFSRVHQESCLYLHTHQQKNRFLQCKQRHTVCTPRANYPPATAFAVECHGLTHHCYKPVFDISRSMCVSRKRGKIRGSNAERGERNLKTKLEMHWVSEWALSVSQDSAGGKVKSISTEAYNRATLWLGQVCAYGVNNTHDGAEDLCWIVSRNGLEGSSSTVSFSLMHINPLFDQKRRDLVDVFFLCKLLFNISIFLNISSVHILRVQRP